MKQIIICCLLSIALSSSTKHDKLNILWIVADDLGVELSCYGTKEIKTPNIDKLAKEGILFTRSYATASICSPSRSSLITGMYPTQINSLDHRTINKTPLPDGIKPITEYFSKAGYFCSNGNAENMDKPGKKDFNFIVGETFDGTDWRQRAPGQPFFAQVQIFQPHRPFLNDMENPINADSVHLPNCYPDHPLLKADWAKYLENVQICDKIVGEVLHRLENDGLADNTIVFFFGDNGRPHLRDKQFLYEGGLKVPLIVRWPENPTPGKVDEQLISLIDVSSTSLSMADITVPDKMQGQVFLGNNAGAPRQYIFGFRQRAGEAVDDIRSISNGHYKLILNRMPEVPWMQMSGYKKSEYPAYALYNKLYNSGNLTEPYSLFMSDIKPEIELYDLESDPMEFNNLADDIQFKEIKQNLHKILTDSLIIFEQNMIPEKPEMIQKKQGLSPYFIRNMEKLGLSANSTDEEIIRYWENKLIKTP